MRGLREGKARIRWKEVHALETFTWPCSLQAGNAEIFVAGTENAMR
jgi:hypothetical protein